MKMKVVDIYLIGDVATGNCYCGQSKDIAKRWSNHARFMKNNEYRYKKNYKKLITQIVKE